MSQQAYLNFLSIGHQAKSIPYFGNGQPRSDGNVNYGFKNLKGSKYSVKDIPELVADLELSNLIQAINGKDTGLFSIGCLSGDVNDDNGFRRTGYIEFALNSKSVVQNAAKYFPIFFHFERCLNTNNYDISFKFNWVLEPAHFVDVDVTGFSCSIFLNTGFFKSISQAQDAWNQTCILLGEYLSTVSQMGTDIIY